MCRQKLKEKEQNNRDNANGIGALKNTKKEQEEIDYKNKIQGK